MSSFPGRVAVVTGASRGIGAAVASRLAAAGARVIGISRSGSGPRDGITHLQCDLTDSRAWDDAAARLLREFGPPDIVVSNAGSFLLKSVEDTTPVEFEASLAVNLRAPFGVARRLAPAMRGRGGRFIHVGSVADHQAFAGNSAYAAAKFGLRALHEVLSAEYAGTGVLFSLVSPGPTDTAIWDSVVTEGTGIPDRTGMLRPDDVADAVVFVASRPPHVLIDWLRLGPVPQP